MPGPRPIPTRLKIIRGNPGKQRLRPEPEPTVPAQVPEAPEFLNGYARAEWDRIVEELYRLGLLTVADIQPIAAYCATCDRWRTAERFTSIATANAARAGSSVRQIASVS